MARISAERIKKAVRDAWIASFAHDVRKSWLIVAVIIGLFAVIGFVGLQPRQFVGTVEAHALGAHQWQTDGIPPGLSVRVRLENGQQVVVDLPRGVTYREDTAMELDVYESRWGGRVYRFRRYAPRQPGF